jgi:hypothetical protein
MVLTLQGHQSAVNASDAPADAPAKATRSRTREVGPLLASSRTEYPARPLGKMPCWRNPYSRCALFADSSVQPFVSLRLLTTHRLVHFNFSNKLAELAWQDEFRDELMRIFDKISWLRRSCKEGSTT